MCEAGLWYQLGSLGQHISWGWAGEGYLWMMLPGAWEGLTPPFKFLDCVSSPRGATWHWRRSCSRDEDGGEKSEFHGVLRFVDGCLSGFC